MMLLRVPAYEILVGLERSVNAEDYNIADKIERLLSDTVIKSQQEHLILLYYFEKNFFLTTACVNKKPFFFHFLYFFQKFML